LSFTAHPWPRSTSIICCPFGEENVRRIESAVADLHPFHRLTTNKLPLEAARSAFGELRDLYLQTDFGKLDCLSEVSGVGDSQAVLKQSVVANFSYGQALNMPGWKAGAAFTQGPSRPDCRRRQSAGKRGPDV